MTPAENYKKWSDNAAKLQDWLAKTQADHDTLIDSLNTASNPEVRSQILRDVKTLKGRIENGQKELEKTTRWLAENRLAAPVGSAAEGDGPA
jgi:hypothetical protein